MRPDIRYAHNGEINIAYQTIGEGPIDLVYVAGALTNLEVAWEQPFTPRHAVACDLTRAALQVYLVMTLKPARDGPLFANRCSRELKGIPGEWRLYAGR
ncbi:MAG TPA: hypothetical protein VGJ23_06865 [Gaiellaceae bacterium]|jgi:hypothetical protein